MFRVERLPFTRHVQLEDVVAFSQRDGAQLDSCQALMSVRLAHSERGELCFCWRNCALTDIGIFSSSFRAAREAWWETDVGASSDSSYSWTLMLRITLAVGRLAVAWKSERSRCSKGVFSLEETSESAVLV